MSKIYKEIEDIALKKHGEKNVELMFQVANTLEKNGVSTDQILENIGNIKKFYTEQSSQYDGKWMSFDNVKAEFTRINDNFGTTPSMKIGYCSDEWEHSDEYKIRGLVSALSAREAYSTEGLFGDKTYYTMGIGGIGYNSGLSNMVLSHLSEEVSKNNNMEFNFDTKSEDLTSQYRDILMNYDKEYLIKNFFNTDKDFYDKETNVNLDKQLQNFQDKLERSCSLSFGSNFSSLEEMDYGVKNYRDVTKGEELDNEHYKGITHSDEKREALDYIPELNKAMCEYFAEKQYMYSDERFTQLKEDLSNLPFFDKENLKILDSARELSKVRENSYNELFEIAGYCDSRMMFSSRLLDELETMNKSEFEIYREMLSEKNSKGLTPFEKAIDSSYEGDNYSTVYLSSLISKVNSVDFANGNVEFTNQKILFNMLDDAGKYGASDYRCQMISAFKDSGLNDKTLMEHIVDRNISDSRFLNSIQDEVLKVESKNGNALNYVSQQENVNYELMDHLINKGLDVTNVNEKGKNALYNILENKQNIDLKNAAIEELNGMFHKNDNKIEVDDFLQKRCITKLIENGLDIDAPNPINGLRPIDIVVGANLDEKITPDREMLQFLIDNCAEIKGPCLTTIMENHDIDTLKLFIDNGYKLDDMLKYDLEASSNLSFKDMDKLEKYEIHHDKEVENEKWKDYDCCNDF